MVKSFNEIVSEDFWANRLNKAYPNLDVLDPWVGIVCENPLTGAVMGALGGEIVARTFKDLRNGDRFWYENDDAVTGAAIEIRDHGVWGKSLS